MNITEVTKAVIAELNALGNFKGVDLLEARVLDDEDDCPAEESCLVVLNFGITKGMEDYLRFNEIDFEADLRDYLVCAGIPSTFLPDRLNVSGRQMEFFDIRSVVLDSATTLYRQIREYQGRETNPKLRQAAAIDEWCWLFETFKLKREHGIDDPLP